MVSLLFIYVWPIKGLSCSYVLHFYPIHPSLLNVCLDFIFHSMQFLILVDLKSTPLFFLFAPSDVFFPFFFSACSWTAFYNTIFIYIFVLHLCI